MRAVCLILFAIYIMSISNCCMAQINLAKGIPVTFSNQPNYHLCTDPEDTLQLTDGKFAGEGFWTDKLAVGWSAATSAVFTVDLGSIKPISGAMFSTASRDIDVLWPSTIYIFVSDDGLIFRYAGDLVELSRDAGIPEQSPERLRYQFKSTTIKTHGRYVRFGVIAAGNYIFCDEIEIYQGEDSYLTQTQEEEIITDVQSFTDKRMLTTAVNGRLYKDIASIKDIINKSKVSKSSKSSLLNKLMNHSQAIPALKPPDPATFKTIFPFNDVQASIFSVYGELLALEKYPSLMMWKKHRYNALDIFEKPKKTKAEVSIEALGNEFRADSFLVTNASSKPVIARLMIEGLKGLDYKSALQISFVPWTDTAQRRAVAAALPVASETFNGYSIKLPAGLTTPIWFTLDTSNVKPGTYKGNVILSGIGDSKKIPISIRVSNKTMQRPRMSLGMWDYAHASGNRAIVPSNIDSAIEIMKSHYVDSPWAEPDLLPLVEEIPPGYFNTLDNWVKRWPDARNFMFFAAVSDNYLGAKINTELFNARAGKWAMAIDSHLRSIGIDPARFTILLVDEPSSDAQDEIIVAWAKAIRASGAKVSLFQDPIWEDPSKTKFQEAITIPDILCPMLMFYQKGPQSARDYWSKIRDAGHKVWFYQCTGPVRVFDPSLYYRQMAWHAFEAGFVGMGFWSFGDLGNGKSSWNEYNLQGTGFAPAFIDPTGVTDSVHWQAVREGVQDYECLAMLKDSIAKSSDTKLKESAQKLLSEAVKSITGSYIPDYSWKDSPVHKAVDDYRIKVVRMLERFR